jgi:hypothetical protein
MLAESYYIIRDAAVELLQVLIFLSKNFVTNLWMILLVFDQRMSSHDSIEVELAKFNLVKQFYAMKRITLFHSALAYSMFYPGNCRL